MTSTALDYNVNPVFGAGESRVSLQVHSVIVDRLAGASLVDDIWSDHENVDFIVHRMQTDREMRDRLATMFLSGAMAKVFANIIDGKTFRSGGMLASKHEVLSACQGVSGDSESAIVMAEFVNPLLIQNSLVSNNAKFAVRRKIPYTNVSVDAISRDLLKQEIAKALSSAHKAFVIPSGTHSTSAIAEQFSDVFRSIGIALSIMNDYDNVLQDIVLGVLANIDPAPLATQRGSVPNDLRMHSVVQQLMTNWTFVQEALKLRNNVSGSKGPSDGISVKCNQYIFDKHAPVVLAMIRSSDRFQMVSRAQFVSTIGAIKVIGLDGVPRSTVLFDNAYMEPTAMVVVSVPDAIMEGAINLQELPDRVSERMMSAYGSMCDKLSIPDAARTMADIVSLKAEADESVAPLYTIRLSNQEVALDTATIAVMLAERVSARFDDGATDYVLVYSGESEHATLKLKSGSIIAGTFTTTDPVEFFLASKQLDSMAKLIAPAQLIPRNALRSRLIGYDENDFVTSAARGGYRINALDVKISGVLRLKELTSIRMGDLATLVVPFHNAQVYARIEAAVTDMLGLAKSIKLGAAKRRAFKVLAQFVLNAAQGLAPAFRNEVHESVLEKAAEKLSYEESIKMRAQLRQHAMAAYTDVLSAIVFLKLQGISHDKETIFDQLTQEDLIIQQWVELGSDRLR